LKASLAPPGFILLLSPVSQFRKPDAIPEPVVTGKRSLEYPLKKVYTWELLENLFGYIRTVTVRSCSVPASSLSLGVKVVYNYGHRMENIFNSLKGLT
jgi:hypothetical protein